MACLYLLIITTRVWGCVGGWRAYPYLSEKAKGGHSLGRACFLRANLKTTLREDHKAVKPFGRMVALVRIKGATRQRGLKLRLFTQSLFTNVERAKRKALGA
eukprot:scaffold27616_cov64-Phaeocystis_antarctica.AAC.11